MFSLPLLVVVLFQVRQHRPQPYLLNLCVRLLLLLQTHCSLHSPSPTNPNIHPIDDVVSIKNCLPQPGEPGEGPGSGKWEVATPESQGLVAEYLHDAEEYINENVGERSCYLVVKNGKIVYEKYRRGREVTTTTELYSHTKSLCSQMFGVASQQGWADVFDKVGYARVLHPLRFLLP